MSCRSQCHFDLSFPFLRLLGDLETSKLDQLLEFMYYQLATAKEKECMFSSRLALLA